MAKNIARMIIKYPTIKFSRNKTTLSTIVTTQKGKEFSIWVSVDSKWNSFLAIDAMSFASALLLPSAKKGESLHVPGLVSAKWLRGTGDIINRVVGWQTGFSPIPVVAQTLIDKPSEHNVGVFFSGGVDSFSSYLKYKNSPRQKITHFIFVHGFDIDIQNKTLANSVIKKIRQIAKKENISLIEVTTNVREVLDQMLRWDMSHGGALAMVALLLRKKFETIIIPGGGNVEPDEPWGSCAYIDARWSTESLKIVHDLDWRTRMDKVRDYIAQSDVALKYLRVCWRNTAYNCGTCDKCLETMINLRICGALTRSMTFPRALNVRAISRIYPNPDTIQPHFIQAITHLKKTHGDPDLLASLEKSMQTIEHPSISRKIISFIHHLDFTYNESRLYVALSKATRSIHMKQLITLTCAVAHSIKALGKSLRQEKIVFPSQNVTSSAHRA